MVVPLSFKDESNKNYYECFHNCCYTTYFGEWRKPVLVFYVDYDGRAVKMKDHGVKNVVHFVLLIIKVRVTDLYPLHRWKEKVFGLAKHREKFFLFLFKQFPVNFCIALYTFWLWCWSYNGIGYQFVYYYFVIVIYFANYGIEPFHAQFEIFVFLFGLIRDVIWYPYVMVFVIRWTNIFHYLFLWIVV